MTGVSRYEMTQAPYHSKMECFSLTPSPKIPNSRVIVSLKRPEEAREACIVQQKRERIKDYYRIKEIMPGKRRSLGRRRKTVDRTAALQARRGQADVA